MEYICVKCASTDVKKVSAVVREGTWKAKTQGESFGFRRDHKGRWRPDPRTYTETHTHKTELAKILTAPDEPFYFGLPPNIFFGIAIGAAWFLTQSIGAFLVILFILCGIMSALHDRLWRWYKRGRKRAEDEHEAWETAMKKWNRLFYCSRCDSVFDPETGQSAPIGEMKTLL